MSTIFLKGAAVLGFIAFSAMFLIWLERKVSAWIQNRMGPMMTGFHGSLQPIADTIKLLLKEDIVPKGVDFLSWWLAPFFYTPRGSFQPFKEPPCPPTSTRLTG